MEERRKVARHRTFKAGHIFFNRSAAIDCRVRNLSPAGALLEVASPLGIPDEFLLAVSGEGRRPCRVIWRQSNRLGVESSPSQPRRHKTGLKLSVGTVT